VRLVAHEANWALSFRFPAAGRIMKSAIVGFSGLCLSLCAGGCVTMPEVEISPATRIAEDASALNDAYGRAVSGQILLNALRARDRWPRQYVDIQGFTNQPTSRVQGSTELGPLPLHGAPNSWNDSTLGFEGEQSAQRGYGVQPVDTDTVNDTILSPTPRRVFQHYWQSGWRKDLLLLVVASGFSRSQAEITERVGRSRTQRRAASQRLTEEMISDVVDARAEGTRPENWGAVMRNIPTCRERYAVEGQAAGTPSSGECPNPVFVPDGDPRLGRSGPHVPCTLRAWPRAGTDTSPAEPIDVWPDDDPTGACAAFQLINQFLTYGAHNLRLRSLPDPTCQRTERIRLQSANAPLISSMASAAARDENKLTFRLSNGLEDDDDTSNDNEPANFVALQRCDEDDAEPVILEVLDYREATAANLSAEDRPVRATYYFDLRSPDEMIYTLGSMLRLDDGNIVLPRADCGENNCAMTLFTVANGRGLRANDYAAVVSYRGQRFFAGPADAGYGEAGRDQTATVLTLIGQIFALNQSPGASAAGPARAAVSD